MEKLHKPAICLLVGCLAEVGVGTANAQGLILPGAGATHRAMAGASTAMGVDGLGALYWNPAAISGLEDSEVVIGGELIIPDTHVSSTIPAGAFGIFGPAATLSGTTRSDSGVGLASGIGVVYRPQESRMTFGMALVTLAGGSVNYPGDPSNPVLAPTGPFERGGPFARDIVLGPQAGSLTVLSIMPTVSYQITDRLAVGASPMVDVSVVSFDPALFGPLDDSNGDNLLTFPTGSHTRPFWGGGFRAGATYQLAESIVTGFSFTSPQWFETWRFQARNEVGAPIEFSTQFTLPTTISAGVAYSGIERLLLTSDVRWLDYQTTSLIGDPVSTGGVNWDSIWAVAFGTRYQLTDRLAVQAGYLFNQNPVPDSLAVFNTMLPALIEHTLSVGAYVQMNDSIGMSLTYVHGFENSVTGSIAPLIGTSTTLDAEFDSLAFGIHIKFGSSRCCEHHLGEAADFGTTASLSTPTAASEVR